MFNGFEQSVGTQSIGLTIAIEGGSADEAAIALLDIDGIQGQCEPDETVSRDGGLTAIATIIGIVGGTMAIAEQIHITDTHPTCCAGTPPEGICFRYDY